MKAEELKGMYQKSCNNLIKLVPKIRTIVHYMIFMLFITFITSRNVQARFHTEMNGCNIRVGMVLSVVNDELFTIKICDEVKIFEEFSYCFGVHDGDRVIFNWDPLNCKINSFSVLKKGTQCGVLCP